MRHHLAHPKGGITLVDEGNLAPKALKEVLSKATKKIVNGDFADVLKVPSPAYFHHPRSFLEGACYDLSYSSLFMTKAALTEDPIERIKLILAMYIGGHHINPATIGLRAPLNPVIGETVQRVLQDGSKFYGE